MKKYRISWGIVQAILVVANFALIFSNDAMSLTSQRIAYFTLAMLFLSAAISTFTDKD